MTCTSFRGTDPETPSPLAVGLCLRYSPELSAPDERGRRHRVLPLAFRDDVGNGRSVPLTDPSGRELGRVDVVEVEGGLRVEVFDGEILKAIKRAKYPMGLAAKWAADRSAIERGTLVTTRASLNAVMLTSEPGYDHCELATIR